MNATGYQIAVESFVFSNKMANRIALNSTPVDAEASRVLSVVTGVKLHNMDHLERYVQLVKPYRQVSSDI